MPSSLGGVAVVSATAHPPSFGTPLAVTHAPTVVSIGLWAKATLTFRFGSLYLSHLRDLMGNLFSRACFGAYDVMAVCSY